jgi:hypothetical protein
MISKVLKLAIKNLNSFIFFNFLYFNFGQQSWWEMNKSMLGYS